MNHFLRSQILHCIFCKPQVKCLKIWSIKYTKSQVINPTRRNKTKKINLLKKDIYKENNFRVVSPMFLDLIIYIRSHNLSDKGLKIHFQTF